MLKEARVQCPQLIWLENGVNWHRPGSRSPVRDGTPTATVCWTRPCLTRASPCQASESLTVGCGEGRFCRLLADRGADDVLGLDLCAPMIEAARCLRSDRDRYQVADVQDLGFLADASFDLAVS